MGRHAEPKQQPADMPEILPARAADIEAAQDALVEQETAVHELAVQIGYEGGLTVGALEDGIRFYQNRTAEACIELGKRLLLLKQATAHGEFLPRLEMLGIERTAATRFMGVARKFSNKATSPLLKAVASQGKVIELLVLDDDEVLDLAGGGTVRGIDSDDVARMGVRELRAALRESREEKSAVERVLTDKDAASNKLRAQLKRIQAAPPDEQLLALQKEATSIMNDALGAIRGQLRQALIALKNHGEDDNSLFMAGLVGQLQGDLGSLREEFQLPDVANAAAAQLAAETAEWAFPTAARP